MIKIVFCLSLSFFVSASWAKMQFKNISVGFDYACGHDGSRLSCFGEMQYGRVVQMDGFSNITQVKHQNEFACALDDFGMACWGNAPALLPEMISKEVSSFDLAADNICALIKGKLVCLDQKILTNMPKFLDHISSFEFYSHFKNRFSASGICAIQDGYPYCWTHTGEELKIPTTLGKLKSIQMHWGSGCALNEDNSLQCWSSSNPPIIPDFNLNFPKDPGTIVDSFYTGTGGCLFNTLGEVHCWGRADAPSLPPGFKVKRMAWGRDLFSDDNFCASSTNNDLFCWGGAYQIKKPMSVVGHLSYKAVNYGVCFEINNELVCTGEIGFFPQTTVSGLKTYYSDLYSLCYQDDFGPRCKHITDTFKIDVPSDIKFVHQFTISDSDTVCAIVDEGKVRCWGKDSDITENVPKDLMGVVKLVSGGEFVCALTNLNQAHCWGNTSLTFKDKVTKDVSVGYGHWCLLFKDDEIQCQNLKAPPPSHLVDVKGLISGQEFSCAYTEKEISCWGDNPTSRDLQTNILIPPVVVGKIKNISSGRHHACFEDDEKIKCWGNDWYGTYLFYQ